LAPTSTMRARPRSSKWVNPDIASTPDLSYAPAIRRSASCLMIVGRLQQQGDPEEILQLPSPAPARRD